MGLLQTPPHEQQWAGGQAAGDGWGRYGVLAAMSPAPGAGASTAIYFAAKPTPLSDQKESLIP